MKLALGTVQFGMDYGITNLDGKTPVQEVENILRFANEKGIIMLDTAPSYGESETALGEQNLADFNIITKTAYIQNEVIGRNEVNEVEKAFYQSLKNLKVDSLYGLFVHQTRDMHKDGSDKLYQKLIDFKEKGLVQKIGVSVYERSEIDDIFSRYKLDMVQLPINVLDQRLDKGVTLSKFKEKNVEIHARSIFLQGVLLTEPPELHSCFKDVQNLLTQYHEDLQSKGLSKLEGALKYINERTEIDYAVIGVNSMQQLKEICEAYARIKNNEQVSINFSKYAMDDEVIIDPRKW